MKKQITYVSLDKSQSPNGIGYETIWLFRDDGGDGNRHHYYSHSEQRSNRFIQLALAIMNKMRKDSREHSA